MVKSHYLYKMLIVATVFIFLFSLCYMVYGVEFNDDIQKITLNYDYFDGIENDNRGIAVATSIDMGKSKISFQHKK